MKTTIKLGISSCLLGESVRWDGDHRLDWFLTHTLGKFIEYVPVCPEAECGLGVPREPLRLVGDPGDPRVVALNTGQDHTEHMIQWSRKRLVELAKQDLWGYVFKSKSPSCGIKRVKVYNEKGIPVKRGVGLFARAFMEHYPLVPAEDEGRLHDPGMRENFIERIFAFKGWRQTLAQRKSRNNLVAFHTRHRIVALSHSRTHYRMMGNLVAQAKDLRLKELYENYEKLLIEALRLKTTTRKNSDALMHVLAYFAKQLSGDEKQELLESIDLYRQGHIPLIVPITLINHYARKYDHPHLREQYYLHRHPLELQLRNHV